VIITSQGGTSYEIMKNLNLAILRTLCGQGFPNKSSTYKFLNMKNSRNMFKISKRMYKNMNKVLSIWSKYWECLNSENLLKYEKYFKDILIEKQDIAGGQIELLFLKDEIFYKKLANDMVMNEIFMYHIFKKYYPDLLKYIPKCYGIASLEKTEKYKNYQKQNSMINFSEKCLRRIESINYGKLKPKKRKKANYIEKINSMNKNNKELFMKLKQNINMIIERKNSSCSPKRKQKEESLKEKQSNNFIIKNLDIFKEFEDFPNIEEIWEFNRLYKAKQIKDLKKSFPNLSSSINRRILPSQKNKMMAELKDDFRYYLALENLLIDDSYSILDFKLSLVRQDRKYLLTDSQYRYKCSPNNKTMKIVGLIIKSKSGKSILNINKGCSYFDYSIQKRFIKRFFEYEENHLDKKAITKCISQVEDLSKILLKYKIRPISSSVLFYYSPKTKDFFLKMVDFANFPRKLEDKNEILGLSVFIECLKEILEESS
jgi:hypothetical protein